VVKSAGTGTALSRRRFPHILNSLGVELQLMSVWPTRQQPDAWCLWQGVRFRLLEPAQC
jgi:hypothetical protein